MKSYVKYQKIIMAKNKKKGKVTAFDKVYDIYNDKKPERFEERKKNSRYYLNVKIDGFKPPRVECVAAKCNFMMSKVYRSGNDYFARIVYVGNDEFMLDYSYEFFKELYGTVRRQEPPRNKKPLEIKKSDEKIGDNENK